MTTPASPHRPDYSGMGSDSSIIKSQEHIRLGQEQKIKSEGEIKSENGRYSWLRSSVEKFQGIFQNNALIRNANSTTISDEDLKAIISSRDEVEKEIEALCNTLKSQQDLILHEGNNFDMNLSTKYLETYQKINNLFAEYNSTVKVLKKVLGSSQNPILNSNLPEIVSDVKKSHKDMLKTIGEENTYYHFLNNIDKRKQLF